MPPIRLVTLDPGHFHAALVQKEMYEGVEPTVQVFGDLGPDLLAHLGRIEGFNSRESAPTNWRLQVYAGGDFFDKFLAENRGSVLVLSGRNRQKIDYIESAIDAGVNVLADKPWIIEPETIARLKTVLDKADDKGLIAYDIMTERFEITSVLQRLLVNDESVFGSIQPGTADEPGVLLESVHYLKKLVAGVPLTRPRWFFDVNEQGEGLTDLGTHLVDLVQWILYPDEPLAVDNDVAVLSGERWPTTLTTEDFRQVTGACEFPEELRSSLEEGKLPYFCNTRVGYRLKGVHVKMDVLWDFEAKPGTGDTHFASFVGSKSKIEIRQGEPEGFRPELYVVPNPGMEESVRSALTKRLEALQPEYPGVGIHEGEGLRLTIPDSYRVGHEAHFAEVTRTFLGYLANPSSLPAWEKPDMIAKYHVTTHGVGLARKTATT